MDIQNIILVFLREKNVSKWLNQCTNNKLFNKIANKVRVGKTLSAIFEDCPAGFHNLDFKKCILILFCICIFSDWDFLQQISWWTTDYEIIITEYYILHVVSLLKKEREKNKSMTTLADVLQLSLLLCNKRSLVRFLVRIHTWVARLIPSGHIQEVTNPYFSLMLMFLSPSIPCLSLSLN